MMNEIILSLIGAAIGIGTGVLIVILFDI